MNIIAKVAYVLSYVFAVLALVNSWFHWSIHLAYMLPIGWGICISFWAYVRGSEIVKFDKIEDEKRIDQYFRR